MKRFKLNYPYTNWPKNIADVLVEQDRQDLEASGLNEKTIFSARLFSAREHEVQILLGRRTSVGSGCVFPYPSPAGFYEGRVCIKLHEPIILSSSKDGKPAKYVFPLGGEPHLYVPSDVWRVIDDVREPLIFTEGHKKALKATQEGFPSVALMGVWGWSKDHKLIKDFDLIALKDRTVYIVFDADKFTNPHVFLAERRFAEALLGRGADVKIVNLPKEK